MPSRSEVICAPAGFPDLKEPFKNASLPALRWWLQCRSLVVFESRKKLSIAESPCLSRLGVVGTVEELQMV